MEFVVTRRDSELYHHGIKGMKWGVRKKNYVTVREAARIARKDGLEARKAARESGQLSGIGAVRKGNKIQRDAAKASLKEQKESIKQAKQAKTKANIKDYNKTFDRAEKAQNIADEKRSKVNERYKNLGKNRVSRFINAAKGESDAAKQYNKSYADWERTQNHADKQWAETAEKYKSTGRNRVERIFNNVRYN